ncbi:MAG: hypothetical protein EBT09_04635 [Actinobacteria bacterium]|nr:hypothetical protein [Actinomycetota bacterium]
MGSLIHGPGLTVQASSDVQLVSLTYDFLPGYRFWFTTRVGTVWVRDATLVRVNRCIGCHRPNDNKADHGRCS